MKSQFDCDYFISFFSAIPEEQWCVRYLHSDGRSCALGHLRIFADVAKWGQADALANLLVGEANWRRVALINDGHNPRYQQPTPKLRILAALEDVKKAQQPTAPAPAIAQPCCAHLYLGLNCVYCGAAQPIEKVQVGA